MDGWTWVAFIFAIIASSSASTAIAKVKKLERSMKSINVIDTIAIKNALLDNIDKKIEIETENAMNLIYGNNVFVEDVDDEWVLLRSETKGKNKKIYRLLIKIEDIKSVKEKNETTLL